MPAAWTMVDEAMVRGLQERAARALPAEYVEDLAGWWLRHAPRCAWWAGATLPHGAAEPEELVRRVVQAERFYARHGAVARFQISPHACPDRLDAVLEERGYRRHSPVSVQTAPTARVVSRTEPGSPRIRVDGHPTAAWFDTWRAVSGGDPSAERAVLERVELPSVYASAVIGNDVVAVGRAVADTGWAGVFGMATLPWARGRGAARAVLAALARWASDSGSAAMYLQVEPGNVAALRLYGQAGFTEAFRYHYRAAA